MYTNFRLIKFNYRKYFLNNQKKAMLKILMRQKLKNKNIEQNQYAPIAGKNTKTEQIH